MSARPLPLFAALVAFALAVPAHAAPDAVPSASGASRAKPAASGTNAALPPGHPQLGDTGGSPHGNPHGKGGDEGSAEGLFEPAPDTVEDDPALPAGTLAIAFVDARGNPAPNGTVSLDTLRMSVAKGDSQAHASGVIDEQGLARFDGLETGSSVSYRVATTRGAALFTAPSFALGRQAGKRVTLHVYPASARIDDVLVGMQSYAYVALKEDAVSIEQLFSVFNVGEVAWTPEDVVLDLPAGWKALNKPDPEGGLRVEEVAGRGVALRGTVAPGRHDVSFRYTVSLDHESRQAFRLSLPPHVAQLRVIAEAAKHMELEVEGFPAAQPSQTRDGKRVLVTERQSSRADGGVREVVIALAGLPTPGPGRWISVALGLLALVVGGVFAFRRDGSLASEEERADLREARDALLDEVVALERARAAGEVGPKTYPRLRAALLDALARVVSLLDEPPSTGAPRRRARGSG